MKGRGLFLFVCLAWAVLLFSTACKRPAPRVLRVEVPVPVPCPPPPAIQRPRLPIEDLRGDSSPADQERAKVATIQILMGYARQLEAILRGYQVPAEAPKPGTKP